MLTCRFVCDFLKAAASRDEPYARLCVPFLRRQSSLRCRKLAPSRVEVPCYI
jgi:hypothetical protein